MWDKGLFGLFGKKSDEVVNSRYKLVQHVVTNKWAVWDSKTDECVSLVSEGGWWWDRYHPLFSSCWVEDKAIAQAAFEAICETGKIWR